MNLPVSQQSRRFGRYEILTRLAAGGMAEVWLARLAGVEGFSKEVVIKTMHPSLAESPDLVRMFINEASLAAQLNHPNVVQIFELGEIDRRYFIAMEFIPGRTLRQIKKRQQQQGVSGVPYWVILHVLSQACEGLQYVHDFQGAQGPLGLVHRDVSPENLMVSFTGAVKLLDFGVAKITSVSELQPAGVLAGKSGYMAPEQVRGGAIDRRADVYALGVVLYELLVGVRPFGGRDPLQVMSQVVMGSFLPPRELAPEIPVELERIVLRALATDPQERYAEASAMREDLIRYARIEGLTRTADELRLYVSSLFPESADIPVHIRRLLAQRPPSDDDSRMAFDDVEIEVAEEPEVQVNIIDGEPESPTTPEASRTSVPTEMDVPSLVELIAGELPPKPDVFKITRSEEEAEPTSDPFGGWQPNRDVAPSTTDVFRAAPPATRRSAERPTPAPRPPESSEVDVFTIAARAAGRAPESPREAARAWSRPPPGPKSFGDLRDTKPPPTSKERAAEHFERGLRLLDEGDEEGAIAEWERAVEVEPETRLYQTNLKRLRSRLKGREVS